jgi:hypothetical protein
MLSCTWPWIRHEWHLNLKRFLKLDVMYFAQGDLLNSIILFTGGLRTRLHLLQRLRTNVSYSLYSFAHMPSWRTKREICFQGGWEQFSDKTLRSFAMVTKPTNTYKRLRVSYLIYIVCLLHVSTALVAILREVRYKGYITKTFWTNAQM